MKKRITQYLFLIVQSSKIKNAGNVRWGIFSTKLLKNVLRSTQN